ncbi:hypothetical protein RM531_08245 [Salinisphaera sp. P385]|uniref:Uncharacterized protein n=1 Tax=Spectribacter acetivorans TaxID=3075603 RepID=A0ABU3B8R9_9GAMM|nr:hypothetical protein [Salinisphaera sp. P385]MDT0618465.1 hypothetical protein [Salinisphaera sp. P385]
MAQTRHFSVMVKAVVNVRSVTFEADNEQQALEKGEALARKMDPVLNEWRPKLSGYPEVESVQYVDEIEALLVDEFDENGDRIGDGEVYDVTGAPLVSESCP